MPKLGTKVGPEPTNVPNLAQAVGFLARAELRRRLRDRSLVIQGVLAPLLLAAIVSAAFGGGSSFSLTLGVVDDSRRGITASLTQSDEGPIRFESVQTESALRKKVEDGALDAGIAIGSDATSIIVIGRNEASIAREIAESVAQSIAVQFDVRRIAAATVAREQSDKPLDAGALEAITLPIQIEQRSSGDTETIDFASFFGPAMGILFLFFAIGDVARSLLSERKDGTLVRLLASPIPQSAIFAGKAIATYIVGVVSFTALWLACVLLLSSDWGAPAGVIVLIATTVFAIAGFGALVATRARTEEQATTWTSVLAFTFAIVGGNFFGPGALPEAIHRLSFLTPNGWALEGFVRLTAEDVNVGGIVGPAFVLVLFGLVTGTFAARGAAKALSR